MIAKPMRLFLSILSLAHCFLFFRQAECADIPNRPNIVILYADDWVGKQYVSHLHCGQRGGALCV